MNVYGAGESMGGHTDGNDKGNPVQFVARWKTADCQGGQLWTEGGEADAGCFWVDGNQRHGVHVVERGQMFSIVTFAKKYGKAKMQGYLLLAWGVIYIVFCIIPTSVYQASSIIIYITTEYMCSCNYFT